MSDYTPTTDEIRNGWIDNGTHEERDGADFDRWLAARDAQVKAKALAPIRAALANHPRCDIHPDDDPIKCGWKRAVADIQAVLDREESDYTPTTDEVRDAATQCPDDIPADEFDRWLAGISPEAREQITRDIEAARIRIARQEQP